MLVPCKRCSRHISDRDEVCPFCRHGSTVARVGAVALSAGVLLSGCDRGVQQTSGQGSQQKVVKPALGRIHGVVKDDSGAPLEAANLTFVRPEQSGPRTATTDAKGHYEVSHLEPGNYTVSISYVTYNRAGSHEQLVQLKRGEELNVDVTVAVRTHEVAPPYGAPPARRRVV
jgi:hypothetical protein